MLLLLGGVLGLGLVGLYCWGQPLEWWAERYDDQQQLRGKQLLQALNNYRVQAERYPWQLPGQNLDEAYYQYLTSATTSSLFWLAELDFTQNDWGKEAVIFKGLGPQSPVQFCFAPRSKRHKILAAPAFLTSAMDGGE